MPCALARQRSSLSLFRRGPLVCAKHVKSTWRRWISPLPPPPPAPREKLAPPCLARPSTSVARPPSPAQRVTAGQTIITHAPPSMRAPRLPSRRPAEQTVRYDKSDGPLSWPRSLCHMATRGLPLSGSQIRSPSWRRIHEPSHGTLRRRTTELVDSETKLARSLAAAYRRHRSVFVSVRFSNCGRERRGRGRE
jgi:hypothetical protein